MAAYQVVKAKFPQILSALMLCCVFTQADQMEEIEAKEEDLLAMRTSDRKQPGEEEDEEEEDYTVKFGSNNYTLRRCAAYALD